MLERNRSVEKGQRAPPLSNEWSHNMCADGPAMPSRIGEVQLSRRAA